jgi:hypothetical protein
MILEERVQGVNFCYCFSKNWNHVDQEILLTYALDQLKKSQTKQTQAHLHLLLILV